MSANKSSNDVDIASECTHADEMQLTYARVLDWGAKACFVVLLTLFLVYVSGIVPAHVPIEDLPKYWGMRVGDFNAELGIPTGWGWLSLLAKADYLILVGIGLLTALSMACQLSIIPSLARKKDWAYLAFGLAQVMVVLLAASGILERGAK